MDRRHRNKSELAKQMTKTTLGSDHGEDINTTSKKLRQKGQELHMLKNEIYSPDGAKGTY